jgi:protocatechuate 3,4-dioxygenase beta subunit
MGRRSKCPALLAALAATALAQQTASVTGTVTNSVTGAPVVRAHVTLRSAKNYGALTNAEGKFSITGIEPGRYIYKAERAGFTTGVPRMTAVTLHEGDNSLDLKLSPLGAISGRVVNADGEPVQLAEVSAEGIYGGQSAHTDSKGQYRIGGLIAGRYRIRARLVVLNSPPEFRTDGSKEVHYRSTYFPGVAEMKEAARITVAPGSDTSGIDIPLLTTPIVKVSGKVLDIPAGAKEVSVEAAEVTGGSCCSWAKVNESDGSFSIWGLDPGKYRLRAETRGNESVQSASIELDLGTTNIEHVELRMVPPFEISGHVEFEDDRARESSKGAGNGAAKAKDRVFYLGIWDGGRTEEVALADDDTFKMEKAQPGLYNASVSVGRTFVKSVFLGSKESEDGTLDFRNGTGGGEVTLVVSAAWGEISGTVSDANGPVSGALVMAIQRGSPRVEQCDASGHYVLKNLLPGTYRLLAGDERVQELWQGDDALADYKEAVATVQVHAGDKITQDLKPMAAGKL